MFTVLHFPFVDLRSLDKELLGRTRHPDWRADDPGECFVRNFGGMSTRNAKAYGLMGERAYVEFEHALAFPKPGSHRQDDWPTAVPMRLWYRRLYFDGDISGRFEIGFKSDTEFEQTLFRNNVSAYDFSLLARTISDLPVEVRGPDESRASSTLERCGEALGIAFLAATTLHSQRQRYPAHELIGKALKVGSAAFHIRTTNNTPMVIPADRRDIVNAQDDHMFLTSVARAQRRNTVTVQISGPMQSETPEERARRVLFAHLNAVLHANDFLTATMSPKDIARQRLTLKELTTRAMDRFETLMVTTPKSNEDPAFAEALRIFAREQAGRIDGIVAKLDALSEDASAPSRLEKVSGWLRGWTEFFADSAIEAGVKATLAVK